MQPGFSAPQNRGGHEIFCISKDAGLPTPPCWEEREWRECFQGGRKSVHYVFRAHFFERFFQRSENPALLKFNQKKKNSILYTLTHTTTQNPNIFPIQFSTLSKPSPLSSLSPISFPAIHPFLPCHKQQLKTSKREISEETSKYFRL